MQKPQLAIIFNLSEGRSSAKIEHIVTALTALPDVAVRDVSMSWDIHRTVLTLLCGTKTAAAAILTVFREAQSLIDLTQYQSAHPYIGAIDVCSLVPMYHITMPACVSISRKSAALVAEELAIPIYLYENSATADYRRALPHIRRGHYAGFANKIVDPAWLPDFGPRRWNPHHGVSVIGARSPLIAYNVNLMGNDMTAASAIAKEVRTLPMVRAIAWNLPSFNLMQISTNILDYHVTNMPIVYERCKSLALQYDLEVCGSEIVGMVPSDAMLLAGIEYRLRHKQTGFQEAADLIQLAIDYLGLDRNDTFHRCHPFDWIHKLWR